MRTDLAIESNSKVKRQALAGRAGFSLSGKLLVLTIMFVMLAEVLIFVPSISNFRVNWLKDRLAAAHTAALVLEASPGAAVPESLAREILKSVGAHAVVMKMGTKRQLLAAEDLPAKTAHDIDMRTVVWYRAIADAFRALGPTHAIVILVEYTREPRAGEPPPDRVSAP